MTRREAMAYADDQQGWKATRLLIEKHPDGNTIIGEASGARLMESWGLGHIDLYFPGPGESTPYGTLESHDALATTAHVGGRPVAIIIGPRGRNLYCLAHEAAHAVAGAGASHKQAWADAFADLLRRAGKHDKAQAWLDIYGGAGLDSNPWWYATSERLSLGQRFSPPEVGGGYSGSSPWGYVRTTQKGAIDDWEEWTHQSDKWDTGEWKTVDDIPDCHLYEVRGQGVTKLGDDYDDRLKTVDGQWRAIRLVGTFAHDKVNSLTYASREASALSWRPVGQSPEQWAQEADCLILTDVRSRKMGRRYEVWVYGRLVGNRQRLEDAKVLAEQQAKAATQRAEVEWTRKLVEPTMVTHYHWGDTEEFSEPLTVYLGNVTLGITSRTASYEELPEGRWTLDHVSTPYYLPSDDFTSITAYARHETEPGIWPVGWMQWEEARDPAVDSDDEEVWSNAKGDINGYYSKVISLRVHPVARRQGIATALWRAFEAEHNNDPDMWDPGEFTPDGAAFWSGMGKGHVSPTKRMDSRWASLGSDPVVRIKEVVRRLQLLSDQMSHESLTALTRIEEGVAGFDAGADDLIHDRGEAARRVLAMYHGDAEPEEERAFRRVLAAVADCLKLMAHAPGYDSAMAHTAVDQMMARVESVFGSRVASQNDRGAGLLVLFHNRGGETLFYLTKRSQWVDDYVGFWAPPGGGVESGEDVYAAAIREFVEESGVDPTVLSLTSLGTFRDFDPDTGRTFTTVVAESPRTFAGTGSSEITADGWFTLDEMRVLELHPGVVRSMGDIRKFML